MPSRYHHKTRSESRRERARIRAHRQRRIAMVVVLSCVLAAAIGLGVWFAYQGIKSNRAPEVVTYKLTLPEGLTVKQTGQKVEEATEGNISSKEFEAAVKEGEFDYSFLEAAGGNLEGFLFPKTYEITSQTAAYSVVNMLLKQFGVETENLEWSRAQVLGVTPYQVVIIASMIEKEAKVPADRPLIASVIYNRLRNNMKLGIDATVQYALGTWKPALTNKDLEVDSPYNTYKVKGLPPAPICSPGFECIRAALYPASTDYIYYILTGADGKHSFTSDYQQFLRWKEEQNRKST